MFIRIKMFDINQFEKEIQLVMDAAAKITEQMRAARR